MENLIKFTTFLNHSTLLEPAGCRLAEEISQGRRAKRALTGSQMQPKKGLTGRRKGKFPPGEPEPLFPCFSSL